MTKNQRIGCIIWAVGILAACSPVAPNRDQRLQYSVQAGLYQGGITENTDMKEVGDVPVDAFTGATRPGVTAGVRVEKPVRNQSVGLGLDWAITTHDFNFKDPLNGYEGSRCLTMNQLMVPLTWNIGMFRQRQAEGMLKLKIGMVGQFNVFSVNDQGALPTFTTHALSGGFTLGISVTPFRLHNGHRLGLFAEGYRGTIIYEDFYNSQAMKMPGSSYLKIGVVFAFSRKP